MQYNLGKFLRKNYNHLLSDKYNENDIYVRASDVDRTLMSAMSNLAGLYPPKDDQVWNQDLKWQPIPVHTVPKDYDRLIAGHPKCPKMEKLEKKVNSEPEILKIWHDNQETIDYISKHSGMEVKSLQDVDFIYDAMLIETIYNKTLPSWTKKVFPDKMSPLQDLSFAVGTWTHELKRLRGGPLVQEILDHFKGFIDGKNYFKMLMFSGHDTTVATLLNTLGMFNPPIAPPYASMIMAELTSVGENYFINILFRNDTTREPYPLSLPNCDYYCPIERFEELTKNLRPQDWAQECDLNSDPTVNIVSAVSAIITFSMSMILLIAVMFSCVRQCTSKPKYQYFKIDPS